MTSVNRRTVSLLALALMGTLVVNGCSTVGTDRGGSAPAASGSSATVPAAGEPKAQPAAPAAKDTQVLRLNLGEEPPSLDPQKTTDTLSFNIVSATQEGLVRRVDDNGATPKGSGLARDWSVSADGLRWTFTLKDGIKWSDGKPVTAHDFEFAWKRALDPRTASQYAYQLYYLKNGEPANGIDVKAAGADQKIEAALKQVGVVAKDDKTLEVTLENPTPYFLTLLYFPTYAPARADIVAKYGEKFAADADKNVYSGPFMVESWVHESNLVLKKNPNYWDAARVRLDQINYAMVKEPNTYVNMYEANELDSINIPGDFIPVFKDQGMKTKAEAVTFYLEFNTQNAIFKNANMRKAVSLAIDRQLFVDQVLKDGSLPATGFVPPSLPGLQKSFRAEVGNPVPVKADIAAAKELLAKGMQELGLAQPPKLVMLSGDTPVAKKYAQGVQEFLQKNLGLPVEIEAVAFKVRLQKMDEGDFQFVFAGWGADYEDPMTFLDMYLTGGGHNNAKWSNGEYDRLIQVGKTSSDQKVRMEAMAQAETILMAELPITPLYFRAQNYVERPYVKGWLRFSVGADDEFKFAYVEGRGR